MPLRRLFVQVRSLSVLDVIISTLSLSCVQLSNQRTLAYPCLSLYSSLILAATFCLTNSCSCIRSASSRSGKGADDIAQDPSGRAISVSILEVRSHQETILLVRLLADPQPPAHRPAATPERRRAAHRHLDDRAWPVRDTACAPGRGLLQLAGAANGSPLANGLECLGTSFSCLAREAVLGLRETVS